MGALVSWLIWNSDSFGATAATHKAENVNVRTYITGCHRRLAARKWMDEVALTDPRIRWLMEHAEREQRTGEEGIELAELL